MLRPVALASQSPNSTMARGILAYFGFRSKPETQEASSTQPTSPKQQGMKRRRSVLMEIQPDSLPQRAVVSSEQPSSTVKTFQYVEGLFICCDPTSLVRQVLKIILQCRSERSTRIFLTSSATTRPLFLTSHSTTSVSPSSPKPPSLLNPFAQSQLRKRLSNHGLAHSPQANG